MSEWRRIVQLVRVYALEQFGAEVEAITIHLANGQRARLTLPPDRPGEEQRHKPAGRSRRHNQEED